MNKKMAPTNDNIATFMRATGLLTEEAIANMIPKKTSAIPERKRTATAIAPNTVLRFTVRFEYNFW